MDWNRKVAGWLLIGCWQLVAASGTNQLVWGPIIPGNLQLLRVTARILLCRLSSSYFLLQVQLEHPRLPFEIISSLIPGIACHFLYSLGTRALRGTKYWSRSRPVLQRSVPLPHSPATHACVGVPRESRNWIWSRTINITRTSPAQ